MKDRIIIETFSVLKSIEIDVSEINILIGPQSHGKSLIAKLVYFFKMINNNMHNTVIAGGGRRELNEGLRANFSLMFPDYLIIDAPFEITYHYGNEENFIKISNHNSKDYKSYKIEYGKGILNEFDRCRRLYKKNTQRKQLPTANSVSVINQEIKKNFDKLIHGVESAVSYFVPAGRSFFVNIEKNIFALLNQQFSIDEMLRQFGNLLQVIKELYYEYNPTNYLDKSILKMCRDLLKGDYVYDKKLEYLITNDKKTVSLKHMSSGQQEIAPLVISLMVIANFINDHVFFFIEEPETHLFPQSQRIIVELFASIYNLFKGNAGFFITTHSPYILTAFNNLIQAENTYREITEKFEKKKIDAGQKEAALKELDEILPRNKRISFDDISVHLVKNGKAKNIANRENKLIEAGEIDKESNHSAGIFDRLLDLSYGEL